MNTVLKFLIFIEKIVVNTDSFIDSFEKLAITPKTFFFFHLDEDIFKKLAKNTFLYRLYHKKVKEEKNYFRYYYNTDEARENEKIKFHSENDLESFFVLAKEDYLPTYTFFLIRFIRQNQFGFMNQQVYYENFGVNYYRKKLDKFLKSKILKM